MIEVLYNLNRCGPLRPSLLRYAPRLRLLKPEHKFGCGLRAVAASLGEAAYAPMPEKIQTGACWPNECA